MDRELRYARRYGRAVRQGVAPAARCAHRGIGSSGQAGRVPGRELPASALPARRAVGFAAPGSGIAGIDEGMSCKTGAARLKAQGRQRSPDMGKSKVNTYIKRRKNGSSRLFLEDGWYRGRSPGQDAQERNPAPILVVGR